MFIGASPGSTGGGVKTSTVGVILAFLRSKLAARESIHLFYRTLPLELISKAYTVVTLGICVIAAATFLLSLGQPDATMEEIVFEVFSAFGTVGLSLGLTPKLHALGKLVIILTMYIGRIGPLSLLLAFSRSKARGRYQYAEENVMIG
jgi:trk system potassium uptake protein TrkH